ncbi:6175_t:CDS:1 [Ambispora leptoticha]|uniref:6175_t:CDS:1 n=1 Tax=Ambispora leptoticha TaxID=144679 RepID=A0A9N8YVC9_9GLOM|nr:6175_t:CDS:1 [Ambispora leptoticha]
MLGVVATKPEIIINRENNQRESNSQQTLTNPIDNNTPRKINDDPIKIEEKKESASQQTCTNIVGLISSSSSSSPRTPVSHKTKSLSQADSKDERIAMELSDDVITPQPTNPITMQDPVPEMNEVQDEVNKDESTNSKPLETPRQKNDYQIIVEENDETVLRRTRSRVYTMSTTPILRKSKRLHEEDNVKTASEADSEPSGAITIPTRKHKIKKYRVKNQ